MSVTVIYAYTVVVTSLDLRSATKTVVVTPILSGSAQLSITSSFTRFNPASKLVLSGYIDANFSVISAWSVATALGVAVPITSLTTQVKTFSAIDAATNVNFPLSVGGGIFSGGTAYTFRLTATAVADSSKIAYTELILTANSPPTSGYISSTPTSGNALVTQFLISSPGWTTDAANFPLSYGFTYRLSSASAYLTVAASSLRAFTTTTLPAGLITQNSNLTLQTIVTDLFLSFSTATTPVHVTFSATTNVSHILTSTLSTAFAIGDVNLALQTVNNVSQIQFTFICVQFFYFSFFSYIRRHYFSDENLVNTHISDNFLFCRRF